MPSPSRGLTARRTFLKLALPAGLASPSFAAPLPSDTAKLVSILSSTLPGVSSLGASTLPARLSLSSTQRKNTALDLGTIFSKIEDARLPMPHSTGDRLWFDLGERSVPVVLSLCPPAEQEPFPAVLSGLLESARSHTSPSIRFRALKSRTLRSSPTDAATAQATFQQTITAVPALAQEGAHHSIREILTSPLLQASLEILGKRPLPTWKGDAPSWLARALSKELRQGTAGKLLDTADHFDFQCARAAMDAAKKQILPLPNLT